MFFHHQLPLHIQKEFADGLIFGQPRHLFDAFVPLDDDAGFVNQNQPIIRLFDDPAEFDFARAQSVFCRIFRQTGLLLFERFFDCEGQSFDPFFEHVIGRARFHTGDGDLFVRRAG